MNILSTGDYTGNITYTIAQFELLIGLKKQGVNIFVVGRFSDEIRLRFTENNIICIDDFPNNKIDHEYINNIKKYIHEYKIEILHVFVGKALRNCIIATKNLSVKLITYMGSTSLHWHDPSSYLTYLNPRVDKIICNSSSVYQHVRNQLFGNNKKKAVHIYKGYDPKWFIDSIPYDFSELGIHKNSKIVCLAANHLKVKGIEYYIKSTYFINSKKNIQFILLGDMRGNKNIPKLIDKSPYKKNIHLLGSKPNIGSYLKSSDIYIQSSNSEGFGRAITEAMCCKKPIIMTDAGGCTELIDKNSGIIVPKKNPKAIAKAIEDLLSDEKRLNQMGENAYDRINEKFHLEKTVQETLKLYRQQYEELQKQNM